jgi:hypothetical protein
MSSFVLGFQDIDQTKLTVVGRKGANLGELSKIEGICVPDGFCISTIAFQRIIEETPSIHELLDQLSLLKVNDRDKISELSGEIRRVIEGIFRCGQTRLSSSGAYFNTHRLIVEWSTSTPCSCIISSKFW